MSRVIARLILAPIAQYLGRKLGVKLREARRQAMAEQLEAHELSEEEMEELKPFVGLAIDYSGGRPKMGVYLAIIILPIGIGLLLFIFAVDSPVWFDLAALAFMVYYLYDTWIRIRLFRTASELQKVLSSDPRRVIDTGQEYSGIISKWKKRTDLETVYPPGLVSEPGI